MKETPILFSTPMVQAILQGRKTQTRRIVTRTPLHWLEEGFTPEFVADPGNNLCPFGKEGDLLWVRESFSLSYFDNGNTAFKADWTKTAKDYVTEPKWKPSIHLKKELARIYLQNTGYKIERLNDISEEDAIAEGVDRWVEERLKSKPTHYKIYRDFDNPTDPAMYSSTAACSFETLWRSIHGPESWKENPWVWAVSFKVVSTTGKP